MNADLSGGLSGGAWFKMVKLDKPVRKPDRGRRNDYFQGEAGASAMPCNFPDQKPLKKSNSSVFRSNPVSPVKVVTQGQLRSSRQ